MQVCFWAIVQSHSVAAAAALADFSKEIIVADNANLAHVPHGAFVLFLVHGAQVIQDAWHDSV